MKGKGAFASCFRRRPGRIAPWDGQQSARFPYRPKAKRAVSLQQSGIARAQGGQFSAKPVGEARVSAGAVRTRYRELARFAPCGPHRL